MHGGEGAVSDSRRDTDEKDERGREPRIFTTDEKPSAVRERHVSVDAYSLASQRRAIAYGRARGRS